MKRKAPILLICIALLLLCPFSRGAIADASFAEALLDVRLSAHSSVVLEDGSIILAGTDGNASPIDRTQLAVLCCTDPLGNVIWQYQHGEKNTVNVFSNLNVLENGDILAVELVLDENLSRKQFVVCVRDGDLISRNEIDASASLITIVRQNLLMRVDGPIMDTVDNKEKLHASCLRLVNMDGEPLWEITLDEPLNLTGILPLPDGYAIYGSIHKPAQESHPYLAYLDSTGKLQWSSIASTSNGRWFDAAPAPDGGITVVGGNFEAADGSAYQFAQIASYSKAGDLFWEREQHNDELSIIFDSVVNVPDGYLAVGANSVYQRNAHMIHYDEKGNVIHRWDEPLLVGVYYRPTVSLATANKHLYLIATGDYLPTDSAGLPERTIYRTMVKSIQAYFTLPSNQSEYSQKGLPDERPLYFYYSTHELLVTKLCNHSCVALSMRHSKGQLLLRGQLCHLGPIHVHSGMQRPHYGCCCQR